MYKQLIQRKLAHLIQSNDASIINPPGKSKSYHGFDENKEKEVVVWVRQQAGLDKYQIMNVIIEKFNISKDDAERLYYEAYPDGLSSQEEEMVEFFEYVLPEKCPQLVEESFAIVLEEDPPPVQESYIIDKEVLQLFLEFIGSLLITRKLV